MTDILLTDGYAFETENGDFKTGDAQAQHIRLLLDTAKGDWAQSPLTGVALVKWLNGRLDGRLEREIQLQMEADGLSDLRVNIENDQIYIGKK